MYKIVLIRHGESEWNLQNKFTGWVDVDLASSGVQEAVEAGEVLKKEGSGWKPLFLLYAIKPVYPTTGLSARSIT